MKIFKLNELTLDKFEHWPPIFKYSIVIFLPILVAILNYAFFLNSHLDQYKIQAHERIALKKEYELKQQNSDVNAYQKQLQSIKRKYARSLKVLVKEKEITNLINKISLSAVSSGLLIDFFAPKSVVDNTLQKELIIKIETAGEYHKIASFFSQIASFNKLITFDNFEIKSKE